MDSTRHRMIAVALLVCLFAVGMAGLLNFFKYRAVAGRIVAERLTMEANAVEASIQHSLALGLHFTELATLNDALARTNEIDDLSDDLEIFAPEGHGMYHAVAGQPPRQMPRAWLEAAQRAGRNDWFVVDGADSAAGIVLENSFGLKIGYLGVRYDIAKVRAAEAAVAWKLTRNALAVFAVSAAIASVLLLAVMRRLGRQVDDLQQALTAGDPAAFSDRVRRGPFGRAAARFFDTVHAAEAQLAQLRGHLARGATR